ncbi:hypothetical protein [Henriciella litoralis]|uniref:hypothetical protein n=1 Tax=Henriciella litoralis TaxID=568102 RepID=UPI00146CA3D3|nr:hypothetical protein [Henriciella litoralis]
MTKKKNADSGQSNFLFVIESKSASIKKDSGSSHIVRDSRFFEMRDRLINSLPEKKQRA